jgi:hypothetical protein
MFLCQSELNAITFRSRHAKSVMGGVMSYIIILNSHVDEHYR